MRGIRLWLMGAALLVGAAGTAARASHPLAVPPAEPPIAAALPGGTVVGSTHSPVADVSVLSADTPPPVPAGPAAGAPIVSLPGPNLVPPGMVPPPGFVGQPGCVNSNCCGPVGAHGPVGQEVFVRVGGTFPIGSNVLPRNLNPGWATQIGGRSLFFDPAGDAAWSIDAHLAFSYNNAGGRDILTLGGEPVIVRDLHRWAVGLGFGRDMFLSAPGFVAGTWDANFRLGWDVGGRWGTGHVNATPLFEPDGYRRHHDVFGQSFVGVMGSMEMPVEGYTAFCGARIEWDYTFADFLPRGSSFHSISTFLMMGVRY